MKNVIIDSDVCNEIDDPFAIAYALTSKKLNVLAITIAPFTLTRKCISVFDGVMDSYNEACRIARLSGKKDVKVFKGALDFVDNGNLKENPATKNIFTLAQTHKKITIIALGTLTNIAILLNNHPEIASKIEVVWLGTQSLLVDEFKDSNYRKDKKAFDIVLRSPVKFTIIPSYVGKFNATSIYEVKEHVAISPLGKHLLSLMEDFPFKISERGLKSIYDVSVVAYVLNKKLFFEKEIDKNEFIKTGKKMKKGSTVTYVFDDNGNHCVWLDFLGTIKDAPTDVFKSQIFFTSDTHFSQKNKRRSKENMVGKTPEQIDHEYIKRWNSVVGKNDEVFHLGDFGNYNIIKKLNGKVTLVCGGYEEDDFKNNFEQFREKLIKLGFKDVVRKNLILDEKYFGEKINLTHKPGDCKKDMFNLFGHVHSLKPVTKNGFNVCLEYHNFTPLGKEFIADYMNFVKNFSDEEVFRK